MRTIGHIKQVQVQQSSLKPGEKPNRVYDPTPIRVVKSLLLTSAGIIGVTLEDEQIIDVHNEKHPASRNNGPNSISISFTSHYQAMRAQFGPHLVDGCAGENILVETNEPQTSEALIQGIAIQVASTNQFIYLKDAIVAAPCVEFSLFAARNSTPLSNEAMKATLQFLDEGRRGFYTTLDVPQEAYIQAGDVVFAL